MIQSPTVSNNSGIPCDTVSSPSSHVSPEPVLTSTSAPVASEAVEFGVEVSGPATQVSSRPLSAISKPGSRPASAKSFKSSDSVILYFIA